MEQPGSRRISRRSLLSLMALGSTGALLAACQGGAPAPAPKPTEAPKPAATAAPAAKPTEAPPAAKAAAGQTPAAPAPAATAAPAAARPAAAFKTLSLRQNWYIGGLHAPFYLGKERGYYVEHGIDLDIGEGAGSAKTVQLVANKSDYFGMADAGSLMLAAAKDAPAKAIMSLLNTSGFGVIFLQESGIKTVQDLEGKRLAVTPGDALTQLWPAVVAANKLNGDSIQLVQMDAAAKPVAVMEKRVDALLGGIDDQFFLIKYKGFEPGQIRFADVGVNTVGISILVHPDALGENPDYIRGFVKATIQAWEEAKKDPDAAVQAALRVKPDLNIESTKDQLMVDISLLPSPNTQGKPIGFGAKEDWENTLQLMKQYRDLQTDKPADFFYTNEFIPNA
jgi:NitT/TauT family transport system substrate-binding protein